MLGGFKPAKNCDKHVVDLVMKIKDEAEKKHGKSFLKFEPIEFEEQIVCGVNYKIKVHIGDGRHIQIKIYEKLPCHGGGVELKEIVDIS
nr:stefin [Tetracapsuloides bryosalmonae]